MVPGRLEVLRQPGRSREAPQPVVSRRLAGRAALLVAAAAATAVVAASSAAFLAPPSTLGRQHHHATAIARRASVDSLDRSDPTLASEWRMNVGHAIDVLRRDTVALFATPGYTPDFSIFSEDVEVVDARLPSFQLHGLATYQQVLATLQWSVQTACDQSSFEITAMTPPVNNEVYMRWRLLLWPKDMLASAKGLFSGTRPLLPGGQRAGLPYTVEGYSRYAFDPWSGEIVRHSIDITNPPMYITDLIRQYAAAPASWLNPVAQGVGVPHHAAHEALTARALPRTTAVASGGSALTGTTAAKGEKAPRIAVAAGSWMPSLPHGCEDDFECNDGKANFPLQCCELPVLGKFCCQPDDFEPTPSTPAYVPLPVPTDPWQQR